MKILHTADWYLGNRFYGHDRTVEHRHFLQWLLKTLRQQLPDVLIVSGNVFDSVNPSAVAEGLFYDFLLEATEAVCGLQIVIISGNRDSSGQLEAAAGLLKRHNVYVRGQVQYTDEGKIDFSNLILPLSSRFHSEAEIVCWAVPYLRANDYPEGMSQSEGLHYYFENLTRTLRKTDFKNLPVIAAAHFNVLGIEVSENERREWLVCGGQDSIRPDVVGKGLSYVALGHVHRAQRVDFDPVEMYYSGCALPMAFSEQHISHGIQLVEIQERGTAHVSYLPYVPLRELMVIPKEGATSSKEVFEAIESLPKRRKDDSGDEWPYLEIRMQTQQADQNLLHEVNNALMDRAVHLCSMVRDYSERWSGEGAGSRRKTLQQLTPLEMAQQIFKERYHSSMPEILITRFKEVEQHSHDDVSSF